ncbi:Transposase OS=Sphingobium scionense OX=1404341 GN=GGQ90_000154 PE=4 SV=1 [Sphingobium scionense]|uniref:Uncharacterized protein n=1 Tax=Sphingobium scionense TaxID=1404341 RepID=A0A7W6LL59_9SPHN|nr:hypothetical protein [Sphingobium scionense]
MVRSIWRSGIYSALAALKETCRAASIPLFRSEFGIASANRMNQREPDRLTPRHRHSGFGPGEGKKRTDGTSATCCAIHPIEAPGWVDRGHRQAALQSQQRALVGRLRADWARLAAECPVSLAEHGAGPIGRECLGPAVATSAVPATARLRSYSPGSRRWTTHAGSRGSVMQAASCRQIPIARSPCASNSTPQSEVSRPPSNAAVNFLPLTAGNPKGLAISPVRAAQRQF